MKTGTITVSMHARWWLAPVIRCCLIAARLTGWHPSEATIASIVRYGVTFQ